MNQFGASNYGGNYGLTELEIIMYLRGLSQSVSNVSAELVNMLYYGTDIEANSLASAIFASMLYYGTDIDAESTMSAIPDRSIETIANIIAQSGLEGFVWFWDATSNTVTSWGKITEESTSWSKLADSNTTWTKKRW